MDGHIFVLMVNRVLLTLQYPKSSHVLPMSHASYNSALFIEGATITGAGDTRNLPVVLITIVAHVSPEQLLRVVRFRTAQVTSHRSISPRRPVLSKDSKGDQSTTHTSFTSGTLSFSIISTKFCKSD